MLLEELDSTHQSFTLVFLCVLRRTSRHQSYGEKQDVIIRLNEIFFFRLSSLKAEQLRWNSASTKPFQSVKLIPSSYSAEHLKRSLLLAGIRICNLLQPQTMRRGQRQGALPVNTILAFSFFLFLMFRLVYNYLNTIHNVYVMYI